MKLSLAFAAMALLVLGCEDPKTKGPSGLDISALDTKADPCQDFYQYACGGWINDNPVGANGSYQAKFIDPYYEALPRLVQIMEDAAAGVRASDDPHAALIGDYYKSCLDAPGNTSGRQTLLAWLAPIDAVATLDDLARQVAAQREVGSHSFFHFNVSFDPGDAARYMLSLDQGGYELDLYYYLAPEQEQLFAAYKAHIEAMSALIGGTPIDADAAIRVEKLLAAASFSGAERDNPESLYHPMKAADAVKLAPTFPWQTFWKEAGFDDVQEVNVIEPDYVAALDDIFKTTPIEDMKHYLRWQLLQDRSGGLDQAFIDEDFAFWSTFTGQSALPPRWFTCYNKTLSALGDAVALPYVARYFKEASAAETTAMVDRARAAFADRLQAAAWLDSSTRSEALAKLEAMEAKIAYPDNPPVYAGLNIMPGLFVDNEIALRMYWNAESRARLGQKVDRRRWNLSPVTVNATYSPIMNDLTIPAVVLTSPFLVAERTEAANFGALGALIGHEMTHGFDDSGRHFDGNGTLRDWWTPAVEGRFVARSQCLVDQFDGYQVPSGEQVIGQLTLGENIADFGGINIAYSALFDGEEELQGGDGFNAKQVFFLSYAQIWCENVLPELQSQRLHSDPHAPGKFRVNGPLSNLPEFREAFSCSEDSPMVRIPACELW